jgi:adenylate cyclase class 2
VYEVELKFAVADVPAVRDRLMGLAARFREPLDQVDRYFAHPVRNFAKTDEALRLRQVGDAVAVTWKGPRIDATTKTRREIELGVTLLDRPRLGPAGPQTVAAWTELLEALGFRAVLEVAKQRHPARVLWHGSEVEVAIDTVTGLGTFVELELQAREGEVSLARDCIESLARELGLAGAEPRSYLELLLGRISPPR